MNNVHFSSFSNEWQTPIDLFNQLNSKYNFQLDAAATKDNTLCKNFYTIDDDALTKDWHSYKSVWLNPPYGRAIGKFIKKAYDESKLGCTVVCLIPSRTDTSYFYDYVSKANEIVFIKGRLKFINKMFPSYREDGNFKITPAPFPSCIVVFKEDEPLYPEYEPLYPDRQIISWTKQSEL